MRRKQNLKVNSSVPKNERTITLKEFENEQTRGLAEDKTAVMDTKAEEGSARSVTDSVAQYVSHRDEVGG